jgi:hypothetical protein
VPQLTPAEQVPQTPLEHWLAAQHVAVVPLPQQTCPEAQQVLLHTVAVTVVLFGTHAPLHSVIPAGQVWAAAPETLLNPKRPPTVATIAALTAVRRDTGAAIFLVNSSNRLSSMNLVPPSSRRPLVRPVRVELRVDGPIRSIGRSPAGEGRTPRPAGRVPAAGRSVRPGARHGKPGPDGSAGCASVTRRPA